MSAPISFQEITRESLKERALANLAARIEYAKMQWDVMQAQMRAFRDAK